MSLHTARSGTVGSRPLDWSALSIAAAVPAR